MGDLLRTLCRKSNLRMSIYADKGHQPKPAKHIKLLHLRVATGSSLLRICGMIPVIPYSYY